MNKRNRFLATLVIVLVMSGSIYPAYSIDLSDKLVKIKNIVVFKFGNQGFGFYDYGAKSFKIFDWKFNIVNEVPLIRGEGPAEIKNDVRTACIYKDMLLLIPSGQNKIMMYSQKGKFVKDLQLDFYPRRIMNVNNFLYIFDSQFSSGKNSWFLARLIDLDSWRTIKEIHLNDKIIEAKSGDDIALSGLQSYFGVGENNNLYVLIGYENTIFEIDESGKCPLKITLPYKCREERWQREVNGEMRLSISSLDFYLDMMVVENTIFACFFKTIKQGKTSNEDIYQTYVIKALKTGKHSKKIFDGTYCILGENNGNLYLFNHDDYKVLPVKLSEWD